MPHTDERQAYVPDDPWEGFEFLEEPPADDTTSVLPEERHDAADAAEFWKSRSVLTHIREYARSRMVSPWAVLGVTLARAVCSVPPSVVIPPTIGGPASLNLFVGLVGNSGDGKDSARKVAAEAVTFRQEEFPTIPLGSGEGLSHIYLKPPRGNEEEPRRVRNSALVLVGEIDTLGALAKRQSSTVSGQLRQGAMGEDLGFQYADEKKRLIVPEHTYRLCLIAGIQPKRSATLLDETDGGTPQRFLWLPATDPGAPDLPPPSPAPLIWAPPPVDSAEKIHLGNRIYWSVTLPEIVRTTIVEARRARLRGLGDALDGHALLTRTKVATALGILDGRYNLLDEDWALAGTIMAVSDTQRALCQRALESIAVRENQAKAVAEAERAVVVETRVDEERVKKLIVKVRKKLDELGPTPGANLRRAFASRDRDLVDEALERMLAVGEVVEEHSQSRSGAGSIYRLK
jgi:hypothetical protein